MVQQSPLKGLRALAIVPLLCSVFLGGSVASAAPSDDLTWQQKEEIFAPIRAWIGKLRDEKNADGTPFKRGSYSKTPKRIDDSTVEVSVHVNTAGEASQLTERYKMTVKKTGGKWEIAESDVVDTYTGLYRETGVACHPFDGFSFDREGMKLSSGRGTVCEGYFRGKVSLFAVLGEGMTYRYAPPEHVSRVATGHDYYAVHKTLTKNHQKDFEFAPAAVFFGCDAATCEELLGSLFTGLDLPAADQVEVVPFGAAAQGWLGPLLDRWAKERKDNAFAHFRPADEPGNRRYEVFVARDVSPLDYGFFETALPGSGALLSYNNWEGWEVAFSVWPKRLDLPNQLAGPVYGYYTEQTQQNSDPYELERRDELERRWHDVESVNGTVELGLEDPETLNGDIQFGIRLKQNLRELPFFLLSFSERDVLGRDRASAIFVNSIQKDGEELTWVSTGRTSGRVIFPEEIPAGTRIDLRMNYSSKSIQRFTPSYAYLDRFGWMPFVAFGDFIDDFDLTIRLPSKYKILGIGHKVEEKVEGDVLISRWKAERPVVFPSIIFGKYRTDTPRIEAKHKDGTVVPVAVHVDEASFVQWGIAPDALRPIAEQAVNAINLYTEISGLEYPYGELNLVNDARGGLYGQAPSSLIYLGAGVFRGAGFLAPFFNNPASISKFLKSVTAHEVGHQWWGSRVSNANSRNYWFVETLAEYFSAVYLEAVYGWKEYQEQVDEWRRTVLNTDLASSVQNASTLYAGGDGGAYQANVYNKGPLAFHMLRETFRGDGPRGPDGADKKFFDFLKSFSQQLAEKREIVTTDIQNAAEEGLGGIDPNGNPYRVDLDWFFDQWIRGSALPQYSFVYSVNRAEDGNYIVEGSIKQRLVIGNGRSYEVVDGQYYRGVVPISIKTKNKEYRLPVVIEGAETPFRLPPLPEKPIEVALNKNGEILAHDVWVNKTW